MKTYVARFENRHGDTETRVFASHASAIAWRDAIAAENWRPNLGAFPDNPDLAAELFFNASGGGFELAECEIEGFAGMPEYLDRFPPDARHYADQAYQDGFEDGAQSEREAPAGE